MLVRTTAVVAFTVTLTACAEEPPRVVGPPVMSLATASIVPTSASVNLSVVGALDFELMGNVHGHGCVTAGQPVMASVAGQKVEPSDGFAGMAVHAALADAIHKSQAANADTILVTWTSAASTSAGWCADVQGKMIRLSKAEHATTSVAAPPVAPPEPTTVEPAPPTYPAPVPKGCRSSNDCKGGRKCVHSACVD